jgi:hypothetical protein
MINLRTLELEINQIEKTVDLLYIMPSMKSLSKLMLSAISTDAGEECIL